jgi:hypothetical protein
MKEGKKEKRKKERKKETLSEKIVVIRSSIVYFL